MISRRKFHGALAAAASGLLAGGPLAARASGAAKSKFPPGKYVDVHTHLGQTWNSREPLTATALLRWMDAHEVAQAIVLPLISPESSAYPLTSDFVLAETRPHRDRLIPFCSVDPRTSYHGGHKGVVSMFQRYIDLGAKGCGEHKPGVVIDDPRNMAIFAACAEVKLPMLLHLDSERNIDKPGLPGLEKVLKEVPDGVFIGHGPGWWASISGDTVDLGAYPRGTVAPGGAIDRLMDKYPNIFGDLSAGSGANAIGRDRDFGREFLIRRADRLMFGTDYLAPGQEVGQFELLDGYDLPEEVEAKIFRDNARKWLKLG